VFLKQREQVKGGGPSPRLSTAEGTPLVQCPAQGSPVQGRHGATGGSPVKATEMIKELEHLSYK